MTAVTIFSAAFSRSTIVPVLDLELALEVLLESDLVLALDRLEYVLVLALDDPLLDVSSEAHDWHDLYE